MDKDKCQHPGCTKLVNNRAMLCKEHCLVKCRCGVPLDRRRTRVGNSWLCTRCRDRAHNRGEVCEAG